jgi:hypothetical protein
MSLLLIMMTIPAFSSCGMALLLVPQSAEKPMKLYEPGMKNPQLEKRLTDLVIKNDKQYDKQDSRDDYKYNDTIAKVYIVSDDWSVLRNQYGIVIGRKIYAYVIGKTNVELKSSNFSNNNISGDFKAGEYYLQIWNFYEDYVGGEFVDTISRVDVNHKERHHINQDEAKKAIKGDFSFNK